MIKLSLFIESAVYLSLKNRQLIISKKNDSEPIQRCIEDVGFLILNNPQISFSMGLMQQLIDHNVAVVFCDEKHMPSAMLLPLEVHHTQSAHFKVQIEAAQPLKKQL